MAAKKIDNVNSPSHYTQGTIECIDAIKASMEPVEFIAFLKGQVIKYNWRMGKKGAALEDAQKAQWYQNRLVMELRSA